MEVGESFNTVSSWEDMPFDHLLAMADEAYLSFTAIHPAIENPFIPIFESQSGPVPKPTALLSHHNVSLQQTAISTIDCSPQEPQGANTGYYRKTISQFAPPKPDNSIRGESRQVCSTDLFALADAASGHCTVSHGEGVNMKTLDRVEYAGSVMSIGSDSRETCVQPNFESWQNSSFTDLLALADSACGRFTATHLGTNYGVRNPFIPISESLSHPNVSLEQKPIITIDCCPQQPQSTYTGCYSKAISQFAPPMPDKAIRGEGRRVAGMQINVEEEKNVPSTKLDNNKTPDNRELSEPVIGSSLAAVYTPLKKNHKLDKGVSHGFELNQPPLPKQRRKKHRPKLITEANQKERERQLFQSLFNQKKKAKW